MIMEDVLAQADSEEAVKIRASIKAMLDVLPTLVGTMYPPILENQIAILEAEHVTLTGYKPYLYETYWPSEVPQ